jgi:hypothetical protein
MNSTTNRETWLNALAAKMAPRFEELGFPIPPFRVAIGFTSKGKNPKLAGECWHKANSADAHYEVLIAPNVADPMYAAATLAHELAHAAAGFQHKHKGGFARLVGALGLVRPFPIVKAGPEFEVWAQPFLDELGPLPHARLAYGSTASVPRDKGDGNCDEDGDGGSSNDKPKQSTRMLKATCAKNLVAGWDYGTQGEPCGYTIRLSRKWALKLGACCPVHGPMEIEGLEDAQDGEEGGDEE